MRIPGTRVQDVAKLEKILKRPITLLDITHGKIFNSGKYRSGKYEEIEMEATSVNFFKHKSSKSFTPITFEYLQHKRNIYEGYWYRKPSFLLIKRNTPEGLQAIWLMGVGDEIQRISQFVLENCRTFRTWKKHTEIIESCKQLVNDAINWQYREGIINEEKKSIISESLKVVDLTEQVFGANYARSQLANKINKWQPITGKINDTIKQVCIEHGYGGRWNSPDYNINDVICIDIKECYPVSMRGQGECITWFKRFEHPTHHLVRVAVNRKLPQEDITGFAQVRSFKFASNIHPVIPVWYGKHFACRNREKCVKNKGWVPIVLLQYFLETGILEDLTIGEAIISLTQQTKVWLPENQNVSCAIIGKFTQGGKIEEKQLTHRLVIDESELDFLIKDCTDAKTFAGREKCPLKFILTYYEEHQPQYTHLRASMLAYVHINLLEMFRRFEPNEVIRIATDSIYIRKETLYKIENIPVFFKQENAKDPELCSHYPSCAMCTNPEEFFISKLEYAKWIKEFQKIKTPLKQLNQPEEQEVREIQPGQ
ncbi:hypothetical protein Glove_261g44 [Diversispora epigaea]|uniref:Uncharacterized protein n=1 Tax=Diversispora epigaea TaxID=1348612 RepID=A0A397I8J0_9GLOM|nr:hypothetical protein Glove_261g44 [Diversispora epigaea]